jgi:hypothetical protein
VVSGLDGLPADHLDGARLVEPSHDEGIDRDVALADLPLFARGRFVQRHSRGFQQCRDDRVVIQSTACHTSGLRGVLGV